jgi:predicted permease
MNLTILFLVIVAAAMIIFDVFIIMKKGKAESISAHIIRGSKKYPLIVLLFGIVLGHLFWSMKTEDIYPNVKCIESEVKDGP